MNRYGNVIVAPLTSTKRGYPTHVEYDGAWRETSHIQCELIGMVSADRLTRPLGLIDPVTLGRVEQTVRRILQL